MLSVSLASLDHLLLHLLDSQGSAKQKGQSRWTPDLSVGQVKMDCFLSERRR